MPEKNIDSLRQAYDIINQFHCMLKEDFEKNNEVMYLSDNFQTLESACGIIGSYIKSQEPDDTTNYKQLVISQLNTRNILGDAAMACDMVLENAVTDSEIYKAATFLSNSLIIILNMTYQDDSEIQTKINNIFEICENAEEALNTLESVTDDICDNQYLKKDGQRLHPRIGQLREAFKMLQPKPENKNDITKNNDAPALKNSTNDTKS